MILNLYYFFVYNSVSHAHSWSFLKPHMLQIIQEIIFPIMQYSEEDEDLYQNDIIEYIRRKFGKHSNLICGSHPGLIRSKQQFLLKFQFICRYL